MAVEAEHSKVRAFVVLMIAVDVIDFKNTCSI
jgi:hypothetical protein